MFRRYSLEFGHEFRCFKGSSGGGGGGAGQVDYPDYMKHWHGDTLDHGEVDTVSISVTDAMNSAFGNSPFTGVNAYNPDADLVNLIAAPAATQALVTLLSSGTSLDTIIADIIDSTRLNTLITNATNTFSADLSARFTAEVQPRFEAGMRDINAVVSSAFVVGRAIIEDGQTRQIAAFDSSLRVKAFSDQATHEMQIVDIKLRYQYQVSQMIAESYRIKIVAKKEEAEANLKIDESDALWDLSLFKYGANMLASISGAAVSEDDGKHKGNVAASVIGGAMTGAAAGAMVGAEMGSGGGPYGAVIGAVVGAAAGLLSQ